MELQTNIINVILQIRVIQRLPQMTAMRDLVNYISDVAGIEISEASAPEPSVPPAIRSQYVFQPAKVSGEFITAILVRDPDEFSPANFSRHLLLMPQSVRRSYLVVADRLRPDVRNRLVARKIPFAVPGLQVNWPELGVVARKRQAAAAMVREGSSVYPASQLLLIGLMLGRSPADLSAKEIARQLHYSPMTISRALDELEHLEFVRVKREGHEVRVALADKASTIWEKAKPKLQNPVRQRLRVDGWSLDDNLVEHAGESALANRSMLSPPSEPVVAISSRHLGKLQAGGLRRIPAGEKDAVELQTWRYDPAIFADESGVDPLSLYLSLEGSSDERVNASLAEMMQGVQWRS
jgi:DNA-binding MarR family transcriptional regulator